MAATLVCVCLIGAVFPAVAASKAPLATVLATVGTNTVRSAGAAKSSELAVRASLYAGDIVTTDVEGKATLLFNDGSQARLNKNARVEITQPSGKGKTGEGLFTVVWGEVWVRIRPGNKVKTKSAAAGALGTEFALSVDEEETTTLTVLQGSASFYNEYGEVVVETSQQSVARLGEAPTTPITIENADFTVEWTLDLERAAIPRERPGSTVRKAELAARVAELAESAGAHPDDAKAHVGYGEALLDSLHYDDALAEFRKADRLTPNQPAILTRIGDALAELGRVEDSEAAYTQALAASPGYVPALVGQAYLDLRTGKPVHAEDAARKAVAADPQSAEARIALGLALMRQPGKSADAAKAFEAALSGAPEEYYYQARAWLALVLLDENARAEAIREAEAAKSLNERSALARGNLALVYLFSDRGSDALREAKAALALSPSSVSALVVSAQALLTAGRVDSAASAAAQAVALDPGLAQAYYVLGIADAQRRDYSHAERDLKRGLREAPDFIPMAATLARVYVRMGREADADDLLNNLLAKYPDNPDVLAALGELAYERGDYAEAGQQYRSAIELAPDRARYYGELARVALYSNRISDAIHAAREAITLAPANSEFHSTLGEAYEYGGLEAQAESEYWTALALNDENALALVKLGFRSQEGDPRVAGRTAGLAFAQGFMLDPAISRDLLRGGIDYELSAGGQDGGFGGLLAFRNRSSLGKTHIFGKGDTDSSDGDRPNADYSTYTSRAEATLLPSQSSNAYVHAFFRKEDAGLPGPSSAPVLDDRRKFRFGDVILGYRHRFSDRNHLWVGFFGNDQSEDISNPNHDVSLTLPDITFLGIPIAMPSSDVDSNCRDVELRLDVDVGQGRERAGVFTVGFALPVTHADYSSNLFLESAGWPDKIQDPDNTGILTERRKYTTALGYMQWAQRASKKLWLATQVRVQKTRTTFDRSFENLTGWTLGMLGDLSTSPPTQETTRVLPSIALINVIDARTWLRFSASQRVTDVSASVFAPIGTLLTTEIGVFPIGLPEKSNVIELDVQRYLASGSYIKLYVFTSNCDNLVYEFGDYSGLASLELGDVRRTGIGAQYEWQLGPYLYSQIGLVAARTRSEAPGTAWNGARAPYQPNLMTFGRINYVDPQGNKAGLDIGYDGSFYQDAPDTLPGDRPVLSGRPRVDLTLAKETGLHNEYFLRVSNVFNSDQIVFNDIPFGERTWAVGWTHRF